MTLKIKLFARARDLAGTDVITVSLPAQSTVAELKRRLGDTVPALRPVMSSLLVAVDAKYASDATVVSPQADVACFPPVSGG